LRLWIKARAHLPLLLYEFAKTGQDKFAVLFNLFVGDVAERIQEYSSRSFVGLGGFGKCAFEALSWSSVGERKRDFFCHFANYLASFFPRYLA